AAEETGNNRRRGDADEKHVVEPDPVEAVFQRKDALDFMRLNHGNENVADRQRLVSFGNRETGKVIGNGEDAAEVVRWVAPFGSKPSVVEVEPTDHRADVEGGLDRLQFKRGAGNAGATQRHGGSG